MTEKIIVHYEWANDYFMKRFAKGDVDMVSLLVENMSPEEINHPGTISSTLQKNTPLDRDK